MFPQCWKVCVVLSTSKLRTNSKCIVLHIFLTPTKKWVQKRQEEIFNITTYHNTPQVVSAMNFYLHFFTSQPQESEAPESHPILSLCRSVWRWTKIDHLLHRWLQHYKSHYSTCREQHYTSQNKVAALNPTEPMHSSSSWVEAQQVCPPCSPSSHFALSNTCNEQRKQADLGVCPGCRGQGWDLGSWRITVRM